MVIKAGGVSTGGEGSKIGFRGGDANRGLPETDFGSSPPVGETARHCVLTLPLTDLTKSREGHGMRFERYTVKAQEALQSAQQLAVRAGHPEIRDLHLLLALLEQPEGIVPPTLRKIGADPAPLCQAARRARSTGSPRSAGPSTSRACRAGSDRLSRTPSARLPSSRTTTSRPSTSCWRSRAQARPTRARSSPPPAHRPTPSSRLFARSAAASASRTRTPKTSSRPSRSSRATSPPSPARGSSTPSSGATTRSAASSRSSRAARRTTPSSSGIPASGRPPSSRDSRGASPTATSPRA